MHQEKAGQREAQQPPHVRKHHVLPRRFSSLRFTLIFFSSSSSSASSCSTTASTRQEINSSLDGCGRVRKPATKSPARFCSHSRREKRGEYKNARSTLRRSSRRFLNRRSRVVMTVVYASGRP